MKIRIGRIGKDGLYDVEIDVPPEAIGEAVLAVMPTFKEFVEQKTKEDQEKENK